MPDPSPREGPSTVAFVTGKLAELALRRTLDALEPELPFKPRVVPLNIAVAALLTTEWVARHLKLPADVDRVVLPGFCNGELEVVEKATGVPAERGPKDLRDLPSYYGQAATVEGYGSHAIEIVAEVNHVPRLSREIVLAEAKRLREHGADVIDLGCDPGRAYPGIGGLVKDLRDEEFRVSVDSLDPREIVPAVGAGAELVLSVNGTNIEVARDLECEFVVVPDEPSTLGGLDESVEKLERWGARYRIDPVLEPIGFGFARSLGRYLEVRRRYPDAEMLMGIGNITELTDADSAPINVVLLGFCEELGIRSVLTTEVIHWARTSVAECDLARRLVHHACRRGSLPKHLEPRLHLLRDPEMREHGLDVLEDLARRVRDRNFRIFADGGEIHVISSEGHLRGKDPFELFDEMGVEEASHAFYLGYEMSKAVTALTLGKTYTQDEALRWGFLTVEEVSHFDRKSRRRSHREPDRPEEGG